MPSLIQRVAWPTSDSPHIYTSNLQIDRLTYQVMKPLDDSLTEPTINNSPIMWSRIFTLALDSCCSFIWCCQQDCLCIHFLKKLNLYLKKSEQFPFYLLILCLLCLSFFTSFLNAQSPYILNGASIVCISNFMGYIHIFSIAFSMCYDKMERVQLNNLLLSKIQDVFSM